MPYVKWVLRLMSAWSAVKRPGLRSETTTIRFPAASQLGSRYVAKGSLQE